MAQWYYSDSERNRHGPLEGAAMVERHRSGELSADTLVWRDGLNQWRPWRELAGELIADSGFAAPASSPAAPDPETAGARTAVAIDAAIAQAQDRADPRAAQASPAQTPLPTDYAGVAAETAPGTASVPAGAAPTASATAAGTDSPYTAPRAGVAEDSNVVHGFEVVPGGFWKRTAAYMIDSTLVTFAYYGVSTALFVGVFALGLFGEMGKSPDAFGYLMIGAIPLIYGVISVCYYVGFESSSMQCTLGKLAVGIKVTDTQGRRLTRLRALGRWTATVLSYLSLGVGFLLIAFTDRKRGLHDMAAGTEVVDRWAYTTRPEMQSRALGPVAWVVLILGGLIWLLAVGLAAFGFFSAMMAR
ncbi:RDD family protein [Pseudomonas sp. CGJS7]|uniref:RDD family protein n=1 Tax=Pseudomonas sp. CGJS7 TaxID=3109348 RepID=UPI00300BD9BF